MLAYLRERELVTNVYLEKRLPVRLTTGETVPAVSFVVDRAHVQYAGRLDVEEAARTISGAIGQSGPNEDYVHNTVEHLKALGISDHWLEGVAARIR